DFFKAIIYSKVMLALGQDEMAKYPFLADAGEYLKDMGFQLPQFGADPDLKGILDAALDRIKAATDGIVYKSDLVNGRVSREAALPREVISFILAIVLLKLCGKPTLVRRFALAEARRAEAFLEKDLANMHDESKKEFAIRILDDLFSVRVKKQDDYFVMPISDYLIRAVHFHEREWKLINRQVNSGMVFLSPHETVRLIRAELNVYISKKINDSRTPEMIPGFEEHVEELLFISKKFATSVVSTGEYPPCIKHAINVLEKGENLPHSGRFMLATFLFARGQSVEQIAPLFKNAPDYNEKITLYQLNHLSGSSGSGTQYICPSCEKLKIQGLCHAIPECDNIITPLQFGTKRK
ncbi:MAG: hypothetical protein OXC46_05300, partial [Thaumarchaeota archaeon]|nr:hypothetical protein [Nitrososphaerota archaeon]